MLILQSFSIEEHEEQPRRESVCWHCHQTPYPFYKISLGMEKSSMLLLQLLPPFRLPKAADAAAPTSNSVPEGHCSSGPTSRIFSDQALMLGGTWAGELENFGLVRDCASTVSSQFHTSLSNALTP